MQKKNVGLDTEKKFWFYHRSNLEILITWSEHPKVCISLTEKCQENDNVSIERLRCIKQENERHIGKNPLNPLVRWQLTFVGYGSSILKLFEEFLNRFGGKKRELFIHCFLTNKFSLASDLYLALKRNVYCLRSVNCFYCCLWTSKC